MYEYRLAGAQGPRRITLELNGNPTYEALSYVCNEGSTSQAPIFSTASIKDEFQHMLLVSSSKKVNPICPTGNLSMFSYQSLVAKGRLGGNTRALVHMLSSGSLSETSKCMHSSRPHCDVCCMRGQDAQRTTAQALLGEITLYSTKTSDNESTEDFHQYSKLLSITKSVGFKVT
jgi:hypothetical protein